MLILLGGLSLLTLAPPLAAQEGDPQGTAPQISRFSLAPESTAGSLASAGITVHVQDRSLSLIRPGVPFPLVIEFETTEQPLEGTLEIAIPGAPLIRQAITVEAPSRQRLLFTPTWASTQGYPSMFPTPAMSNLAELTVTLRSKGQILYTESFPLYAISASERLVAEVTDEPPTASLLWTTQALESPLNGLLTSQLVRGLTDYQQRHSYSPSGAGAPPEPRLDPAPPWLIQLGSEGYTQPAAWAPYSLVALHGVDPRNWSEAETAALQDWVLSGGVLLLWPSSLQDWDPLWPIGLGLATGRIPSTERSAGDIAALGEFIDAPLPAALPPLERFPLHPSFTPVVRASDGVPLLGVRRYGRGAIALATIDCSNRVLADWRGLPLLLRWMADWGFAHSAQPWRRPGDQATDLSQQPWNHHYMPQPEQGLDAHPLASPLVNPSAENRTITRPGPVQGLLAVYLVTVLAIFPWLRRQQQWRWLWGTWGLFTLLALLIGPAMIQQPVVSTAITVPIAGPGVPTQQFASELFTAERGSFDATHAFQFLEHPLTPTQQETWLSQAILPSSEAPYLRDGDYVLEPSPPARATEMSLPLWARRVWYGHVAPDPALPSAFRVASLDLNVRTPRLELEVLPADFQPQVIFAALRRGTSLFGGELKLLAGRRTGTLDLLAIGEIGSDDLWNRGWASGYRGDIYGPGAVFGKVPRAEGFSGPLESLTDPRWRTLVEQTRGWALPGQAWVEANGGLVIMALEFPVDGNSRPVEARIWYDPTPVGGNDITGHPLVRFGYSAVEEFALNSRGIRLTPGTSVQFSTDRLATPGEHLSLTGEARPADVVVEQYVPGEGWQQCPPTTAYTSGTLAFKRAQPPATIGGEALFRIRAIGPVALSGVEIISRQ